MRMVASPNRAVLFHSALLIAGQLADLDSKEEGDMGGVVCMSHNTLSTFMGVALTDALEERCTFKYPEEFHQAMELSLKLHDMNLLQVVSQPVESLHWLT